MSYKVFREANYLYFVTCTIVEWIPVFTSIPYFQIIIDSLKFCRENKGLKLNAYVIMPNHLHLIAHAGRSDADGVASSQEGRGTTPSQQAKRSEGVAPPPHLSNIIRDFKRHTSKAISKQLEADNQKLWLPIFAEAALTGKGNTKYKIWQDGFHPEAIYSERFYRQKLDYLHDNPCRKGFVASPHDWLHSSARNYYLGDDSIITIDKLMI